MIKKTGVKARQQHKLVLEEVRGSLEGLRYGSVEIYVNNGKVTQITRRVIKKMGK